MSQSNFIYFLGRGNGKELAVCNYINVNLCPLQSPQGRQSCLFIIVFPAPCSDVFSHLFAESPIKECKFLKDKVNAIISLIISLECIEGTVYTC